MKNTKRYTLTDAERFIVAAALLHTVERNKEARDSGYLGFTEVANCQQRILTAQRASVRLGFSPPPG